MVRPVTEMEQHPIRLIVGLGNPGGKYEMTRHNAGYWFVDRVAREAGAAFAPQTKFFGESCRIRLGGCEAWLLKPTTFMNRSGQSVSSFARYFRLEPRQILVAHDELDLPPGTVRLKQGGGHAGHNGLRDIISALGGAGFWRLRIGIAHPGDAREVVDYVLGRPSREDEEAIEGGIARSSDLLALLLSGDLQRAMHQLHS